MTSSGKLLEKQYGFALPFSRDVLQPAGISMFQWLELHSWHPPSPGRSSPGTGFRIFHSPESLSGELYFSIPQHPYLGSCIFIPQKVVCWGRAGGLFPLLPLPQTPQGTKRKVLFVWTTPKKVFQKKCFVPESKKESANI